MTDDRIRTSLELEYLTRREAEERVAARRSGDLAARHAHIELADRYALRARTMQVPEPLVHRTH